MSSPIKSVLECVKFQAITGIVRDWGSSAQQFPFMSQRGWQRYKCIIRVQPFSRLSVFNFLNIWVAFFAHSLPSCCLSGQEKPRVKQWPVSQSAIQLVRRRRKWLSLSGNNRKSLQLQLWFFKATCLSVCVSLSLCLAPHLKSISKSLDTNRISQKCWKWSDCWQNPLRPSPKAVLRVEPVWRLCIGSFGNTPVMKGNKKVNRKCNLDADRGSGYTTRVTTLFPLWEQSEKTLIGLTVFESNVANENKTKHGKYHQAASLFLMRNLWRFLLKKFISI